MWIRKELFKGPSASLAAFQTISQFLVSQYENLVSCKYELTKFDFSDSQVERKIELGEERVGFPR